MLDRIIYFPFADKEMEAELEFDMLMAEVGSELEFNMLEKDAENAENDESIDRGILSLLGFLFSSF